MGRAGAEAFASEGALVVVADIDEVKATSVVEKIRVSGGEAHLGLVDVDESARVQGLVEDTVGRFDWMSGRWPIRQIYAMPGCKSLGKPMSLCLFALAETMVRE